MTPSDLAAAQDYADALTTARRAKFWLFLAVLFILLLQLGLFFGYRFGLKSIQSGLTATPDTKTIVQAFDALHYLIGLVDFLGIILALVFVCDLWLIAHIMLVGRLIGLSRVLSALIVSIFLVLLLFPWQAFMARATFYDSNFKVPGVLYTWNELLAEARWHSSDPKVHLLHWTRFVVSPLIALILLLMAQIKSDRGIRQAQGEAAPETGEGQPA